MNTPPRSTTDALREDPALGVHVARLASLGGSPIDCMLPGRGNCCEQGSEFGVYNFCFAEQVGGGLIEWPGKDGTFLDSIDWPLPLAAGLRLGTGCAPPRRGQPWSAARWLRWMQRWPTLPPTPSCSHCPSTTPWATMHYYLRQLALQGNAWHFYEGLRASMW